MGAGLAKQVRSMFPNVFREYSKVCRDADRSSDLLGMTLIVDAQNDGRDYTIANLFSQDGYGRDRCYTNYDALRMSVISVRYNVKLADGDGDIVVRIPYKMGCGLAGGSWDVVESIIINELVLHDVNVEVWKR